VQECFLTTEMGSVRGKRINTSDTISDVSKIVHSLVDRA
jgi:hypothetical protein